jgi:predicted small integral membrane protein
VNVIDWISEQFDWMRWSWQSAIFFGSIISAIVGLTVWDIFSPGVRTRRLLPMPTTRGDRLFLGIILTIGLFLVWLAIAGNQALWGAAVLALAANAVLARWG